MVAVNQVGRPGRRPGGRDYCVEAELLQGRVDARRPAYLQVVSDGGVVGRLVKWVRLGEQEKLLAEELQLVGGVRLVKRNGVGQRVDRNAGARGQVGVQISFEVENQHDELRAAGVDLVDGWDVGRVDDDGSRILDDLDRRLVNRVGLVAEPADAVARDANPRAL